MSRSGLFASTALVGVRHLVGPAGGLALLVGLVAPGWGQTYSAGPASATGVGATAVGPGASAIGDGASAFASNAAATALGAIAVGRASAASGPSALAVGDGAVASNSNAIAIGTGTQATQAGAVALGNGARSTGVDALALGTGAVATGSVAVGYNANAGNHSTAIGDYAMSGVALEGTAIGYGATVSSAASMGVAIGAGATANVAGSVAVGAGAVGNAAVTGTGTLVGGTTTLGYNAPFASTSGGAFSVGSPAMQRQIKNVADGVDAHDAATVGQVATYAQSVNTAFAALPLQFSTVATPTVGNAGVTSQDVTLQGLLTAAPVRLHNLAAGTLSATSTDAVNGSQLFALGTTSAANQGGGAAFNPITGSLSAPAYTIGSTSYTNAGDAFAAINTTGIRYFHVKSTGADSSATGTDAIAIGSAAAGSATGAVAIGQGATATVAGGVTLGAGSTGAANTNGTAAIVAAGAAAPVGFSYTNSGNTALGAVSLGAAGALRQVKNIADGSDQHDAVSVAQLTAVVNGTNTAFVTTRASVSALGTVTAAALGGGAAYQDGSGLTAPSYALGGTTYHDVGSALASLQGQVAAGQPYFQANATGPAAVASGVNAVAIGPTAVASHAGGVALGAGAVDAANTNSNGSVALATSGPVGVGYANAGNQQAGAVSVGSGAADTRQIKNVADGSAAHDAATVGQLAAVASGTNAALATLGTSVAANQGGGSTYSTTTGAITAPSYTIGATTYTNTGDALTALNTTLQQQPVRYATAGAPTTPAATPSQDVTFVGAAGGPVGVHNVAAGLVTSGSADATNGGQLFAVANSVATALGGGSTVGSNGTVSAPSYTIHNVAYSNVGGALAALDTAVSGGGIAYFHANSSGPDSSATGADAVAIGPRAVASHAGGVALGAGAVDGVNANSNGAVALATAGPIALGYANAGNTQTGAVSVGAGATDRRQIQNVADGVASSDAATVGQVAGVASAANAVFATMGGGLAATIGGGMTYNTTTGAFSAPSLVTGGHTYATVASALAGMDALAVQYTADASGAPTNAVDLSKGGTLSAVALTGLAPATTASGAVTLSQLPLQYSSAGGAATPGTVSNDVTLLGAGGGPVVIHNLAPGLVASDAATVGQVQALAGLGTNAVQYDLTGAGTRTNTVTMTGGTAGAVRMTNVAAAALAPTSSDAVTGAQLFATNQAVNNMSSLINGLDQRISTVARDAHAGTALALAASGLRYDDRPGKTALSGATSVYHGQVGLAFGLGHTSQDAKWKVNASVSLSPSTRGGDVGATVGGSYTFD